MIVKYSSNPTKKFKKNFFSIVGKPTIITFHSLADLDCCASAIAIQEFLGKNSIIAMQDSVQSEVKNIIRNYYSSFLKFSKAKKLYPNAKIIVLDCNEKNLLLNNVQKADFLIDHHALSNNSIKAENSFVCPEASSTAELVAKIVQPSKEVAALLVLAIVSDSAKLIHANYETFYTLYKLLKENNLNFEEVCQPLYSPLSAKIRMEILKALPNIELSTKSGYIVATGLSPSHPSLVAEALIKIGADVAFVASIQNNCVISARMHKRNLFAAQLPLIMKKVAKVLGGEGGGHPLAAAASGPKIENSSKSLKLAKKLFFKQIEK
ncbi:MAG: DHH family phosphoesterase [Candidatus Micrarchaeota archaeon]|nr:DHH family phosphoesterase [Candidatus Micrarchaeota archaeon]